MSTGWTWLVYIATDNRGGADVSAYADESVGRMRKGLPAKGVRVLVEQHTPTSDTRLVVGAQPELANPPSSSDSGDPNTLLDFVKWGVATAPADRYALVLWSHGGGWRPKPGDEASTPLAAPARAADRSIGSRRAAPARAGLSFLGGGAAPPARPSQNDREIAYDATSKHALDTVELGGVLAAARELIGHPIDLLAMNACQMASVEVAYQLRQHVAVYVASEVNMPAEGLPYDDILPKLGKRPKVDALALGKLIVESYCAFFKQPTLPWSWSDELPGATLTAINLAEIERVGQAVNRLSAALNADLRGQSEALFAAIGGAFQSEKRFLLYDLASFCQQLAAHQHASEASRAAARELLAALASPTLLVARDCTTEKFRPLGGLTTFLLQATDNQSALLGPYAGTDYARATGWGSLLNGWVTLPPDVASISGE